MNNKMARIIVGLLAIVSAVSTAKAIDDARLLRYPDINKMDQQIFLWSIYM